MPHQILAIETSTEHCSVALLAHNTIEQLEEHSQQKASLFILPMIQKLLSESKLKLPELDAVAFSQGPGTFTGVRLGASIAQGIAFAHDLPVIPISSLACLAKQAHQVFSERFILSALDARMGEVYWGAYSTQEDGGMNAIITDSLNKPSEISVCLPPKVEWIGAGSGWDAYHSVLETQFAPCLRTWFPNCYPTAKALIALAIRKLEKGETKTADQALPVYLRAAVNAA